MTKRPKATTDLTLEEHLERPGILELILGVIAFIAYAGTLAFGFVYDDRAQITNNPAIRSWASVPAYFTHHVWALIDPRIAADYYRPVFLIWLRLNYALFGSSPAGWHFTSLALHIIASLQVFWLALLLLRSRKLAFIASLLFVLHPVHIESVAWISGVTDPLSCVLMLGCVLAYLRWLRTSKPLDFAYSLLSGCLALLTKEPAIVLPFLLAATVYAIPIEDSDAPIPNRWRGLLPFFLAAAIFLFVRHIVLKGFSKDFVNTSTRDMIFTWPSVIVFYIRQLFFPVKLSLFHDVDWVRSIQSPGFILPFVILTVLAVVAALLFRLTIYKRQYFAALCWTLIPLAPVLYLKVFQPGELVHDRYLYVSSVGFCLLLVISALTLLSQMPEERSFALGRAAVIGCALIFASLTIYNQMDWASDLLLFTHASEVAPKNDVALVNLGTIYIEKGDHQTARELFQQVVDRNPNHGAATFNLGHAEYDAGEYAVAEKHVFHALQLEPDSAAWWMQFAGIELRLNKLPESETAARQAISLAPNEEGYHAALGAILMAQQRRFDAQQAFQQELQLHPGNQSALRGLAALNPLSPPPPTIPR